MAEYSDREHFIPIRKADLVNLLCRQRSLSETERKQLRQLATLLEATFHYEYHQLLESLKTDYAPFDPDSDTHELAPLPESERSKRLEQLFDRFNYLLERANFKKLTQKEIEAAMEGKSDWGLDMEVDFGVFDRFAMYVRGEGKDRRYRRIWWKAYKLEEFPLTTYRRLVLIMKLKKHRRLDPDVDVQDVFLKIFKDIPKLDIEMLLPGARVKLSKADASMIGFPLLGGLATLVWKLFQTAITFTLSGIVGIVTLAFGAIGIGTRSFFGYLNKQRQYTLQLTKSLYYQNLDSNSGVLYRLLDDAEEQECREALLAYFFLWKNAGPTGWTSAQLDDFVELFLENEANVKVDFEVGDALDKLKRLGLLEEINSNRYIAVPISTALERLDYAWDNYFKFNTA